MRLVSSRFSVVSASCLRAPSTIFAGALSTNLEFFNLPSPAATSWLSLASSLLRRAFSASTSIELLKSRYSVPSGVTAAGKPSGCAPSTAVSTIPARVCTKLALSAITLIASPSAAYSTATSRLLAKLYCDLSARAWVINSCKLTTRAAADVSAESAASRSAAEESLVF